MMLQWDDEAKGLPEEFFSKLKTAQFEPGHESAARNLAGIAHGFWGEVEDNFYQQVRSGGAEVFARWRELDAPLQPITAEQLYFLRLERARSPNGRDQFTLQGPNGIVAYTPVVRGHRALRQIDRQTAKRLRTLLVKAISDAEQTNKKVTVDGLKTMVGGSFGPDAIGPHHFRVAFEAAKKYVGPITCIGPGRPKK